ncbi:MAG TPA: hypothetical protein VG675_14675 [Bryobacteraceae bacterium]|nr:hypothetical protein [Bryobacteraceae bacterium]
MNLKTFALAIGTLALGLSTLAVPAKAQGPLYDKVTVDLPYSVTVGNQTLQPGHYVIRELPSASKSYVLLIYGDNGMKFKTSAMTIPTLDQKTPENTEVILHHFGPEYYFDKIWIQGKNYGYEFPLPSGVRERQQEQQEVAVNGKYENTPPSASETAAASETSSTQPESTTSQSANPPAQSEVAQTTPPPESQPTTSENTNSENQVAQNTPPANENAQTTTPAETEPAPRQMPQTSAGWVMMLLSGGVLSGAGLTLRRKR